MKTKFSVCLAIGALCIATSSAFAGVKLDEAIVGKVIEDGGPIELGFWSGPPVAFPAGKWKITYRDESTQGFGRVYRNVKFTSLTADNVSGGGNVPWLIIQFNSETGNFSESGNKCSDEIANKTLGYFNDFGYSKTAMHSICVMISPNASRGPFNVPTGRAEDFRVNGELAKSVLAVRAFGYKSSGRIIDMRFPVVITSMVVNVDNFMPGSPIYKDAEVFGQELGKRLYSNIVDGKTVTIPEFTISK